MVINIHINSINIIHSIRSSDYNNSVGHHYHNRCVLLLHRIRTNTAVVVPERIPHNATASPINNEEVVVLNLGTRTSNS